MRTKGKQNPLRRNEEWLKILQTMKKVFLGQIGLFIPKLPGSLKKKADVGKKR